MGRGCFCPGRAGGRCTFAHLDENKCQRTKAAELEAQQAIRDRYSRTSLQEEQCPQEARGFYCTHRAAGRCNKVHAKDAAQSNECRIPPELRGERCRIPPELMGRCPPRG